LTNSGAFTLLFLTYRTAVFALRRKKKARPKPGLVRAPVSPEDKRSVM
jgi:hypothetical protein